MKRSTMEQFETREEQQITAATFVEMMNELQHVYFWGCC